MVHYFVDFTTPVPFTAIVAVASSAVGRHAWERCRRFWFVLCTLEFVRFLFSQLLLMIILYYYFIERVQRCSVLVLIVDIRSIQDLGQAVVGPWLLTSSTNFLILQMFFEKSWLSRRHSDMCTPLTGFFGAVIPACYETEKRRKKRCLFSYHIALPTVPSRAL